MEHYRGEKRKRDEGNRSFTHRTDHYAGGTTPSHAERARRQKSWAHSDQARINQLQEAERHREFLAQEGQFVLQQKRKAAEIRVKEGRARTIDWLTVNLRIIDPIEDLINDDVQEEELDYNDPESVIGTLSSEQLSRVRQEIDEFLDLETKASNRDYWRTMRTLCKHQELGVEGRAVRSVSSDIDNLLRPKSYDELEKVEKQINAKLNSDEPIDTDYWQQLLDSLLVYKAKAKLRKLYTSVLENKLLKLRADNVRTAEKARSELPKTRPPLFSYSRAVDPDPLLNLDEQDKSLLIIDEKRFLSDVAEERRKILKSGYVPAPKEGSCKNRSGLNMRINADGDRSASNMFDREAAKGVEEDEEVFAGEEDVVTKNMESWKGEYRPRKPRYFNRVQMGYEWNKYNQTHYDHDNPPPKVVQGYKFHIFYPDLIDPSKAPTYKIIREGGRKKGETVAPAGEEDTCIIRFMSGPPYEDVAFRIIDRDWDYSAKHDRGFKSTFENGILTLHFSFKKVYYRK